jgi:hypothetical protein
VIEKGRKGTDKEKMESENQMPRGCAISKYRHIKKRREVSFLDKEGMEYNFFRKKRPFSYAREHGTDTFYYKNTFQQGLSTGCYVVEKWTGPLSSPKRFGQVGGAPPF